MKLYAVWEMRSGKTPRKVATLYARNKDEARRNVKLSNPEVNKKDMFLAEEGGKLDKNLKNRYFGGYETY